jgi:hypothetical protein
MLEKVDPKVKLKKVWQVSRIIFFTSIALLLSNGILPQNPKFATLGKTLISLGLVIFTLYWMFPVFLLIVRKRSFAMAWYAGPVSWNRLRVVDFKHIPVKEMATMYLNFATACAFSVVVFFLLNWVWHGK